MLWPSSTPSCFGLPNIQSDEDLQRDSTISDGVICMAISKTGYAVCAVTRRGVYLFRPKPLCPVASYIRTDKSIELHGENETVFFRSDGSTLGITTSGGSIMIFTLMSSPNASEVCTFGDLNTSEELSIAYPGPGESIGVRELKLRYSKLIRVQSQIGQVAALEDKLVILTKNPQALQITGWIPHNTDSRETKNETILLSKLSWLPSNEFIVSMARSRAMSLLAFVTYSGNAYTATMSRSASGSSLDGHIFHKAEEFGKRDDVAVISAINARFSMVALGCKRGSVYLYSIHDYHGNVTKLRSIDPPSSSTGRVQCMRWSSDGVGLFVGYEKGWALFSVYGMLNASSFLSKLDQRLSEDWLDGIKDAVWSFAGDNIMIVANNGALWALDVLKWSACGNYVNGNLQRPVLYTDTKLMVYRAHEQNDISAIDRDALQWLHVTIPANYIAENWPLRYVTSSEDGRYLSISGIRGLAHYSVHSGRWKLFAEESMDREFTVRGGMVWYEHFLIAAVDTEDRRHELRVFSREKDLEPQNVIARVYLAASVLEVSRNGSLLIVYTYDNTLSFFQIEYNESVQSINLHPEGKISFHTIVQSPARVRTIQCLDVSGKPSSQSPLLILVDGQLVLLRQVSEKADEVEFSKLILHSNIEHFSLTMTEATPPECVLWAFDGRDMLVWLQNLISTPNEEIKPPCSIPVESYPLVVLPKKGIFMGVESDSVWPRETSFTYFKQLTSTQLYVPHVLAKYIVNGDEASALKIAKECMPLKYFSHILEMFLYLILDNESESEIPSKALKSACDMLKQFPQWLDVIVGCTRKTELSYWRKLFEVAGSPHEMFENCITLNKLRTAGGYLLVLHNLENRYEENIKDTAQLMRLARKSGDWELCKDLARFLMGIDETGKTLRVVADTLENK